MSLPMPPTQELTLARVVAQLAAEVSGPLTQALNRVAQLAHHGSIDRQGLSALRTEIDGARRAGLLGQQIARFADGDAQPGIERVELGAVLRQVLSELASESPAGAPGHQHTLIATQVMGDASLIHTVLHAAATWARDNAQRSVQWYLEAETWQPQARLTCRFTRAERHPGPTPPRGADALDALDSLDWLLLRYAAHLCGASVARDVQGEQVQLSLRFRHLVAGAMAEMAVEAVDHSSSARALLTGCQLLVLASRREARQRVREALRGHEVFIDYVPSVAAADTYCDDGYPQVLLYEASFNSEPLQHLKARLGTLTPVVTMIELLPSGQGCEFGPGLVRLGAEGLAQTLSSVLLMELARHD